MLLLIIHMIQCQVLQILRSLQIIPMASPVAGQEEVYQYFAHE